MDREIFHQIIVGLVCNLLIVDCGLHEGWATITLPKFAGKDPITLTSDQEVLVINLMYVGVGIGAIAPIFMMDRIGRKWTLLAAAVPKIFSWIAIGLADSHVTLCAARLLAGVGCGISYSVMPMYIGEISTKRTRGPLGTLQSVLINIGVVLICTTGLYVDRFVMAMMSLVVPLLFIVTFIWLPESSVYLTRKNRLIHATKTLRWSLGKDDVTKELEEIKRIVSIEDEVMHVGAIGSLREAVKLPATRRAAAIMFLLANTMSLTGAAPIFAYQSFIYDEAGYHIGANIGIIISGCAIVLAGIVCVSFVKITGKRRLLLFSIPFTLLCLGTIAIFFTLKAHGVNVVNVNWIPTVFVVIYFFFFGLALNPMPLAYLGELFSFDIKVTAGICSSLYYAICTTVVVKLYQVLTDSYGTHVPFWVFTGITFIIWILTYFYVLETEGMSLEEIQNALYELSNEKTNKSAQRRSIVGVNPTNKIVLTPTSVSATIN